MRTLLSKTEKSPLPQNGAEQLFPVEEEKAGEIRLGFGVKPFGSGRPFFIRD
ncbi:hypothetical protein [Neolewinella aurantiaca]|uniref:hypothetical protein n=1 Tax=Neolewinella aurantiaca TaxID=2602767 RepID=UPI00164F7F1B|nr:hypothetical protein [Neolewinella aurantiaca]